MKKDKVLPLSSSSVGLKASKTCAELLEELMQQCQLLSLTTANLAEKLIELSKRREIFHDE